MQIRDLDKLEMWWKKTNEVKKMLSARGHMSLNLSELVFSFLKRAKEE